MAGCESLLYIQVSKFDVEWIFLIDVCVLTVTAVFGMATVLWDELFPMKRLNIKYDGLEKFLLTFFGTLWKLSYGFDHDFRFTVFCWVVISPENGLRSLRWDFRAFQKIIHRHGIGFGIRSVSHPPSSANLEIATPCILVILPWSLTWTLFPKVPNPFLKLDTKRLLT